LYQTTIATVAHFIIVLLVDVCVKIIQRRNVIQAEWETIKIKWVVVIDWMWVSFRQMCSGYYRVWESFKKCVIVVLDWVWISFNNEMCNCCYSRLIHIQPVSHFSFVLSSHTHRPIKLSLFCLFRFSIFIIIRHTKLIYSLLIYWV
jgi:hypothetical protein